MRAILRREALLHDCLVALTFLFVTAVIGGVSGCHSEPSKGCKCFSVKDTYRNEVTAACTCIQCNCRKGYKCHTECGCCLGNGTLTEKQWQEERLRILKEMKALHNASILSE